MSEAISFKARARAIDHLGRGQIADTPTAISELWKNAYDAYATDVSLHIFSGRNEIAAIFDDGIGMDKLDILNRWLVIGTESKIQENNASAFDTLGLKRRPRQGEKGIGRLSVAFLAPITLVVSKKENGPFVVVMIDWRIFENPFLDLSDVKLPVQEFDSSGEVVSGITDMKSVILGNFFDSQVEDRSSRLLEAWTKFDEYESQNSLSLTSKSIKNDWLKFDFSQKQLEEWPVFLGLQKHGTALFMIGVHHELNVWLHPNTDSEESHLVKERLRETLTGFVDPFAQPQPKFEYEVWVHYSNGKNFRILGSNDMFGAHDLHELEHYIDGEFDSDGVFKGKVVAFGEDLGVQSFVPKYSVNKDTKEQLGPFKFCIGTFEQDLRKTTHSEQQHAKLLQQAEKFGGVTVYRDDLRVMPYGREDADFLGIESRRGRHAGRYFWAHRRSFGRIAFTRTDNPNLRDKAGREGLVDNKARRELRLIVSELLVQFAAQFFGTDSEYRKNLLPEIMARHAAAKAQAEKARLNKRKSLRQFLKEKKLILSDSISKIEAVKGLAASVKNSRSQIESTVLEARFKEILLLKDSLRPPIVNSKLGDLEEEYREYRDKYSSFSEALNNASSIVVEIQSTVGSSSPKDVRLKAFENQEKTIQKKLENYENEIENCLKDLSEKWSTSLEKDRHVYRQQYEKFLNEPIDSSSLLGNLNLLDAGRMDVEEELSNSYLPFISSLKQLIEGIDLDSAFISVDNERAELEEKVKSLQSVAQVGITVEIIGHELATLEGEVRRNLNKLPEYAKNLHAFKMALNAHLSLADALRFLTPMKVAGYRAREKITGKEIFDYTNEFFQRILNEKNISFSATDDFLKMSFLDIPSRIYPVFINLINNSIYWVSNTTERKIALDFQHGEAIISDTGPGVDIDDVPRLFELFFSRRHSGRGVGLYLSRANLGVGGHKIRYAGENDLKIHSGANFIINFRGVSENGK